MLPTQPIAIAKYGKIFQKAKQNDVFCDYQVFLPELFVLCAVMYNVEYLVCNLYPVCVVMCC